MPRFDKTRLPSRYVTEGPEKAPMRAMMLGTGLAPEDLDKPLIGSRHDLEQDLALQHAAARPGPVREDGRARGRRHALRVHLGQRDRRHRQRAIAA